MGFASCSPGVDARDGLVTRGEPLGLALGIAVAL
jgi:hypothetical protein